MRKSFTRIGVCIWNSIPHSVKTLNLSNLRKKNQIATPYDLYNEDDNLNVACVV